MCNKGKVMPIISVIMRMFGMSMLHKVRLLTVCWDVYKMQCIVNDHKAAIQ